ncbi:MAG: cytochrome c [Planctomycetota bacterium]
MSASKRNGSRAPDERGDVGRASWIVAALLAAASAEAGDRQVASDRGLAFLHDVALQGFGLDEDQFDALWTVWPEPLRQEAADAAPGARRALALDRYGLVVDPDRTRADGTPSDVPAAFAEGAPGRWTLSCLACHSGTIDGRFVHGLGNNRLALQTLMSDLARLKTERGLGLTEQEKGMVFVPLGGSDGTTNAQVFSVVLASFRDPDLERTSGMRPMLGVVHHDLDAPPLWNVRRKSRLYLDGYVEKDPRVVMQFTLGLATEGATVRGWEPGFEDVLAWIESLEPPTWPGAIDDALAAEGRVAFEAHCAECHGTYGEERTYPERRIPLDVLGTDPVRARGVPRSFRAWMAKSWLTRGGEVAVDLDPEGYVAPPLDGIWATAPYLHNGSVPTLWHLLRPAQRPRIWRRERRAKYDADRVGLPFQTAEEPPETDDAAARRRWFDASKRGKSSAGHEFPERLDERQKRAVLEYLKTL